MEVLIGSKAGFCFGVKRAVDTAKNNADKNICILGELIHNQKVIDELTSLGVETISDISQANNRTTIIRTHGEAKKIF